tara:strand:+ start:953 stop:1540 length:588 start_codon:yes stop_codon:yes gene_type:complete
MSEDISDKIENDEWIENERAMFECADGVKRRFRCESGTGYNQECGGWEHTETGQIYAVASWGENAWKNNTITRNISLSQLLSDGEKCNINKVTHPMTHHFNDQMLWWFEQKDIDVAKLIPVRFTWKNPHGGSHRIENGPQVGQTMSEVIPACIPRGYYGGIKNKTVVKGDMNECTVEIYNESIPTFLDSHIVGGN